MLHALIVIAAVLAIAFTLGVIRQVAKSKGEDQ